MYPSTTHLSILAKRIFLSTALAATLLVSGCKDDDPAPVNEEELITTVKLSFQAMNGESPVGDAKVFTWKDLDGSGSNAPVIDDIDLDVATTYTVTVTILNESNAQNVQDITEEISEENTAHQFFYSTTIGMTTTYLDIDSNGKPLGLKFRAVTGNNGTPGTFKITLRHEPDKNAANVSSGDITNAGGETDIEAIFPIGLNS